ncbi:TIGR00366 family protein [Burkholderia sp. Ax-1719]|jgi:short-chain fatty acids transporter|uniref:short-chain fatty acid transporter n=1 Tax=Burkholderia sp. Ax-1719 TaxID=2608334 RepID=UPI00141E6AFE|nr:TIGR00366 family protein [Burkholderia sp. Ax-1719]NIE62475.1 short-chain fatty acid transporter [Burkholderia sp. Ax-1719]
MSAPIDRALARDEHAERVATDVFSRAHHDSDDESINQAPLLERLALRVTAWCEKWYPDAYVFVAFTVLVVALGAMAMGASPRAVSVAFGNGFWSLIPFTMQMAMVAISGYVIASSPPVARLVTRAAQVPRHGRAAVAYVAFISVLTSLLHWAISLVFAGLLVRELARRTDLRMDYRAAGAAAYLGIGATWALGLSSSAAQLQANAASIPAALLPITGVIPFSETLFLWQSLAIAAALVISSTLIAWWTAPAAGRAKTAHDLGIPLAAIENTLPPRERPGEFLEYSPALTLVLVALGAGWLWNEFATHSWLAAISGLNTYNLLFLLAGMLLHWRPRSFLQAVSRAVPATAGVLIQFPLYGAIAGMLTGARGASGETLSHLLSTFFVSIASTHTYALLMGVYSSVLGFFVPSGGGKWIIEAPYVMEAANRLHVHAGWAVQIYNAAEALPNLINPFWMLPLLGILGLKARDLVGFTFAQFLCSMAIVLTLLSVLAPTLVWHAPVLH